MASMRPLEPPDTHTLSAAVGWLELGNPAEAKAELARISAAAQGHPDVLEVGWLIRAEEQDWNAALAVARRIVEVDPDRPSGWLHRAYALRRADGGGLPAAWEALRPAHDKFPREPVIAFNLACYACQMGQLAEARAWLQRAVKAGGKNRILAMALRDADLAPLQAEIRRW
jgi:Flp pilus assembly protein TadD